MAERQPKHDHRIDTVDCVIMGGPVTVQASYACFNHEQLFLVDFACCSEGLCGIPTWDPCPVYIRYLEGKA